MRPPTEMTLAELIDLNKSVQAEINRRIRIGLDDFIGSLAAHYGYTSDKLRRTRRTAHEAKRVGSYYLVAMKGLNPSDVAKELGITRQMVGRHVRTVQGWKEAQPREWFRIFNIIQHITR